MHELNLCLKYGFDVLEIPPQNSPKIKMDIFP